MTTSPTCDRSTNARTDLAPEQETLPCTDVLSSHSPMHRAAGNHLVQLYDSDAHLVQSVSSFLVEALRRGEGALVIGTAHHDLEIAKVIAANGYDLADLRARGQYVSLDASPLLARFTSNGVMDREQFDGTVGLTVQRLSTTWPGLSIFGEMVAILWERQERETACQLEELWNELARHHTFTLLCAYPIATFGGSSGEQFSRVCRSHSAVIPAESYAALTTPDQQARTIAALQQKAAALEVESARRRHVESDLLDFLENAAVGIHKVGPDGTILWANQAELDLLGYCADEYIGHHIAHFHVDRAAIEDMLMRLSRRETLRDYPATLRCRDGSTRNVLVNSNALFVEDQFAYSRCFTRDVTELASAHEAAKRLAAIVDSSDDAIISKTLDGTVLSWNKGAERLFGYSASEAVGRPITLIIPPELHCEERSIQSRLGRGEQITDYETVRVTKSGERRDISLTISPVRDAAGTIIGASKIARDISTRKRAEEALREREERYELVLAGAEAAIWDWDLLRQTVNYSPRWCVLRGLPADEVLDGEEEWLTRIHPEDVERVRASVRAHLDGGTPVFTEEYRVQHGNGHWIWVSNRGIARRDATGRVVRMAGSETDISARKQAEDELRVSEERFRHLAQLLPVGLYTCEARSGCITFYNDHAATLWGRAPELHSQHERFCGASQLLSLDGAVLPHMTCPMAVALREGRAFRNQEVVIERPDHSRITVLVNIEPLRDRDGRVTGAVNVFHDISAVKQAEEALREADRRKDEFLATLAHELRNPLAPIRNSLDILRLTADVGPSARRVHAVIERQVKNMVRLVDDLLELSRITRGAVELKNERIELQTVLAAAIETSRPLIDASGHRLTASMPEEPVLLSGDSVRLTQVFANLLNNAAKYTNSGGSILLQATREENDIVVRVQDTGIGISAEMLPRVFDMFAQVPNPLRPSREGLGIGLSLVRTLVAQHGGSVAADSAGIGQGSAFVVRLPVLGRRANLNSAEQAPSAMPLPAPAVTSILVADDNQDAADSLGILLKLAGTEVHVAYDGVAALKSIQELRPAVAFLDVGMPGLDGCEVAQRVRRDERVRDTVLVAITGWGQPQDRQRTQAAGFNYHLVKPVGIGTVQAVLASMGGSAGVPND